MKIFLKHYLLLVIGAAFCVSPAVTIPLILNATSGAIATISCIGAVAAGLSLGSHCFLAQFAITSAINHDIRQKNNELIAEKQSEESVNQQKSMIAEKIKKQNKNNTSKFELKENFNLPYYTTKNSDTKNETNSDKANESENNLQL